MRNAIALALAALASSACSDDGAPADGGSSGPASDSSATSGDASDGPGSGDTTGGATGCAALQAEADALAADGFSGVLAVVRAGEPLLWSASGECIRESSTQCSPTTVFDIGSITKQFTAAAILALQEDGALSVDDTLDMHLPGVPADKAAITLHQLLTHIAGVPDILGDDYEPIDREAWLAEALAAPLVDEPGAAYLYSNVGYSILAAIIELRAGTSYEEFLHARLFEPAGLEHTGYVLPSFDEVVVAHGYRGDETIGAPNALPWDTTGPWWNLRGNGGILSDLTDMLAWHDALATEQVLSAASKDAMYTPWVDEGTDDSFYGYGWVILDVPGAGTVITHNGGNDYFFADFVRFVDLDLVIVVLDNAATIEHEDIAGGLAEIALLDCD